jgi:nicotinamidase-related amidase
MSEEHDSHDVPDDRRGGIDPNSLVLHREGAMLLVVDVQERLAKAMPPEVMAQVEKNTQTLIKAAQRLKLPVVVSEQYRKGLGPTVPSLQSVLEQGTQPIEKLEFSCGASMEIARALFKTGRRQVIVAGMESHVCVFQTVRDLQLGGYRAFVAQDAVVSRTQANREVGLKLMEKAGATMSSTEAILFDLLGVAGTPEFKELSALIK